MTTQTRNDGRSNAMLGSMVSNDKFCGITKFSGEDKTYSSAKWAADIEDNAEIFGWSARQKLIVARQSLVGTAQLWLRSEETYKTFEELNAALQNEFPDELNLNSKEMHEHRYPEEENDSHRHNSCEEEPEELSDSQEMSMSNSFEDDVNKQSLHNEKEKLMNICEKSVNMLIDNGNGLNVIVDDVYIVKSEDEMKTMRDEPIDMKANLKDIPEAQWPTRISSMEQISVEEEAEWWREGIIQESYLEYSHPLVSVTRRNTRKMIKFINQVIPGTRKIRREAIHEIKKMKRKKEKKVIRKKTRRKKRKEVILGERKIKVMMNE